jgi:hypothetical protein
MSKYPVVGLSLMSRVIGALRTPWGSIWVSGYVSSGEWGSHMTVTRPQSQPHPPTPPPLSPSALLQQVSELTALGAVKNDGPVQTNTKFDLHVAEMSFRRNRFGNRTL